MNRPDVAKRNKELKTRVIPPTYCIECNGEIPIRKFASKRKVNAKFCNRKCYSIWRSKNNTGKNAPNYKDGKCNERLLIRASLKMREWRKAVFTRDNYSCQECGDNTGGNLEADHIKPFALYPELRFEITNGRTLCRDCHKATPTYGFSKLYVKTHAI